MNVAGGNWGCHQKEELQRQAKAAAVAERREAGTEFDGPERS